jgi:hypothetical protein
MKKLYFVFLMIVLSVSAFAETYGQIQNRFILWYKQTIMDTLNDNVSRAIDNYNENKTFEDAKNVLRQAAARQAYWATVRNTAQILYEQLGNMGAWKYDQIYEQAWENYNRSLNETTRFYEFFEEKFPDKANAFEFGGAIIEGLGYFGNYFGTATR